jgi:hypothetical protein
MAQITEVRLVDDLDGGEADESVEFALDGKDYMIDLSSANAEKLRKALADYVGSARKAGKIVPRMTQTSSSRTSTDRERTQQIKSWAAEAGLTVNERGRIAIAVIEAFDNRGTTTGEAMLNDLLAAQGSDRTAPVTASKDGGDTANPKGSARTAEDVTDEEVLAYRGANGLEVKRRGKDGTGKVYPMAMASYRKHYMEAHGIAV